jgi:hypothetical protein
MREGLSHRIVAFISNLLPIYTHEVIDEQICARSLVDGTLILPVEEEEDNENGFVTVHWQGDPSRSSEVIGTFLAGIAVAKYVEIHAIPNSADKRTKYEFAHMAQHFHYKTGTSLGLEEPDTERTLIEVVTSASKSLGKEAVRAIVSAKLGGMV